MRKARETIEAARAKHLKALTKYPPSNQIEQALDQLITSKRIWGFLPLSNFEVRRVASEAMIEALLWAHKRNRTRGVRSYLFTATFDDGIILETATEIPLYRIERKVRAALRSCGLQSVNFFEIDILKRKLPGDDARRLLVHVHGVCWTGDRKFRANAAAAELNGQRRFRNRLGVPAIKFVTRKQMHANFNKKLPAAQRAPLPKPQRDQTASSIARMAAYMTKAPTYVKNRFLTRRDWWAVRYDEKSFNLRTSLLMTEIWSRISAFDAAFAVGQEAKVVLERYRSALRAWARKNSAHSLHLGEQEIDGIWRSYAAQQPRLKIVMRKVLKRPPG